MEITQTIPTSLPASDTSGNRGRASAETRPTNPDKAVEKAARRAQSETTQPIETKAPLPNLREVKVELHIDEQTGEVYGRIIDQSSGDAIAELPAESLRRLSAHIRSQFDHLIDKSA